MKCQRMKKNFTSYGQNHDRRQAYILTPVVSFDIPDDVPLSCGGAERKCMINSKSLTGLSRL